MATRGPEDRERFARDEEGRVAGPREPERLRSIKVVAGGSITEAVCGAGTVVLAILGLAGVLPGYMASVAAIAFGVALLAQGSAIAARYSQLVRETLPSEWETRTELGGGMGAELLAGAAGVVLGVLGLLGLATAVLIPVAVIVFGAALLLGSGATVDLGALGVPGGHDLPRFAHAARQVTVAASGAQMLVGIGAVVLGIVALVGIDPVTVTLVALLVTGASTLVGCVALSGRMARVLRRS
jgi:hypothetical protein